MNLILKDKFIGADGLPHQHSMKLKPMADGSIHIWVNNGEDRYSVFKLWPNMVAQLIQFLQRTIK